MSGPFIRPDADRVGILKIPRVKLAIGATGVDDGNVSSANPMPMTPAPLTRTSYSQAGAITIGTILATIDCRQFKSVTWHCTSMGTSGVVTPEWSSDNASDWRTATFFTPAGASATTFNAAGQWGTNVAQRYLRFRLSTGASGGTTTINIDGCVVRQQTWLATQPVSGTVTATVATTTNIPSTGQGSSTHLRRLLTNDTNAVAVKGGVGVIGIITLCNDSATKFYFKMYNKATAPTLASDTPVMTVPVPANTNVMVDCGPWGIRLATGIAIAVVRGIGDTDTTAPAANDGVINMSYT